MWKLRTSHYRHVTIALGLAAGFLLHAGTISAAETESAPPSTQDATSLNSMDEQYAWVGDLGDRDALPGKPLYGKHCAGCHEAQVYKAPHTTWLELMSPQVLYRSITEGIMQSQARTFLTRSNSTFVEYITQMRLGDPDATPSGVVRRARREFQRLDEARLTGWGR